jgi:hypothetical protein
MPWSTWLLPCGLAAVYVGLFVFRFAGNIAAIDWVSDYSSGFTRGDDRSDGDQPTHGYLHDRRLPRFGLLTARVPSHRQVWEIMPTLLFVGSAFTIGWSVSKVAGRRAALLSTLPVLVASPWALRIFMAAVAHNVVYPGTALLGAYLVWLARGEARRRVTAVAVPALSAVSLGVCIASDALLIVTGVIPLAIAAVAAGLRRGRQATVVSRSALATALGAVPIAVLTSAIMRSASYITVPPPAKLAPFGTVSQNFRQSAS